MYIGNNTNNIFFFKPWIKPSSFLLYIYTAHAKILKAFDDLNALKRWRKRDAKIKTQDEVVENATVEYKMEEPIRDTAIIVSPLVEKETQDIEGQPISDTVKDDKKTKWTIADIRTKFLSIWRRRKVEGEEKVQNGNDQRENLKADPARYPSFIQV